MLLGNVYNVVLSLIKEYLKRYILVWGSLCVKSFGPSYPSITCSNISNIPYNLIFTTKFNDSWITIISWNYLNLPSAN